MAMTNKQLEEYIANVDAARVALEEKFEKLEAWLKTAPAVNADGKGVDSMGFPRVIDATTPTPGVHK